MSNKRTLKELLADQDLYLSKTGPADEAWKQRLLLQLDRKRKIVLMSSRTDLWVRLVSIVVPSSVLILYIVCHFCDVSIASYIEAVQYIMTMWIKIVSPWGSAVFGSAVLALTMLALSRKRRLISFLPRESGCL